MTVNSEHQALIRYTTGDFGSYDAADTDLARTVRNNLHHALDSFGQVLVAWGAAAFGDMAAVNPPFTTTYAIHVWTSPPFYVRIQPDGSPFPVRVAVNGCERDPGGGVAEFRVALTTTDLPEVWAVDALADDPDTGDPAGASYTWVATGSGSAGSGSIWLALDKDVLTLPASRLRGRGTRVQVSTVDAIGGAPTTVDMAVCRITIWYGGTDASVSVVYAAEYCGGP